MNPARKREVIDVCLNTFMKKGLAHTPTKDLCAALNLNTGGVFYYFKTKDEIVIACAEEAAIRIERDLIGLALKDIENPEKMMSDLRTRADEMRPLMKFFVSVCSCDRYAKAVRPIYEALNKRYDYYVSKFSEVLVCEPKEVAPYVYIGINTMLAYMLFEMDGFVSPQIGLVCEALKGFLERRERAKAEKATPADE